MKGSSGASATVRRVEQPLSGIRVVELATGIAGPFAGKLLADYGADVVKAEPPGGDPGRGEGPIPPEGPGLELGPLHLHLATNKRSVVLDPSAPGGHALAEDLLGWADVVVDSDGPGDLARLGLDSPELRRRWPGLVRVSATAFGRSGPYAGRRGAEIVAYAMGGPMNATGLDDREPLKLAGNVVSTQCGSVAAVAALAALRVAEASGVGPHVDVAAFQTQAASIDRRTAYLMWRVLTGRDAPREGAHRLSIVPAGIYPTADGYVQVVMAPNWVPKLAELLGDDALYERVTRPGWADDPNLAEDIHVALLTWCVARTSLEAMTEAQARNLGVMAVNPPAGALAEAQFRSRGFWVPVDHPRAGRYETPGAPVRLRDGWRLRRPAPLLDEHAAEVRAELAVAAPRPARPSAEPRLPLDGVRVLDLTVVWAGPACTMLLGDLGAEVIRVDNPNRYPTATRGAIPRPPPGRSQELGPIWGAFPGDEPGPRPWNTCGAFVSHARSKLGATLDLRTPLGRETFLRLVERSDVVVENNSAKVLDRLDLGWEVLRSANPRLVLLRMPSLGLEGPYAHYVGFGAHVEALCGLTALRGYRDLDATSNGATYHMDPTSGSAGAFAVLAALRRRERTGEGELVELAQAENLLNHIGEYLVDASRGGRDHGHAGNRHPTRAPQGCYRCLPGGPRPPVDAPDPPEPGWVVLSVGDDDEWAGLRRALGDPAWAADERFATAAGRREHHDELDAGIEAWTCGRTAFEAFESLQAEGVPSGPVLSESALLEDPHLRARGFFRRNGSPDLGEWEFPGHLFLWDGPPLRWGPVNRLGADNEYVYRQVLGLDDDEWAALEAEGHLRLDYVDADGNPL